VVRPRCADFSSGSRYQADRNRAGIWTPDRQLPSTAVLAGSRAVGPAPRARAVDTRCGGGAAFGARFAVDGPVVADEAAVAGTFHHRVGGHRGWDAVGVEALGKARRPSASFTGAETGDSMPAFGSCSTRNVGGQPAGLAGQRLQVGAAHLTRPGIGRSCRVSARAPRRRPATTRQSPTEDLMIRANRDSLGGSAVAAAFDEVEPGGQQRDQDGQRQESGGEPEVPLRERI